jgi:hypothetical protein
MNARKKILTHIHISPDIAITPDDIVIYDRKIVMSLILSPQAKYTLSLDTDMISPEGKKVSSWDFTTPENKTLLLRSKEKVTLYDVAYPPTLEILAYNSERTKTQIKVCNVDLENYAKTEVFLKNRDIERAASLGSVMSAEVQAVSKKLNPQEEFFYN